MSYSGAESSMEDGGASSNGHNNHRCQTLAGSRRRRNNNGYHGGEDGGDCASDPAAWNAFSDSFSKVQSVLDRNRVLIQQANENHQSRTPDNMVKNVAIIQELNGNISQVASLYSDLSANFTGVVRLQRGGSKGGNSNGRRRED